MALIKIEGRTAGSVFYVGHDSVTTLTQRSDETHGLTRIHTGVRLAAGKEPLVVDYIWSLTPLESLLAAFGPFVRVRLRQLSPDQSFTVSYVKVAAIVTIQADSDDPAILLSSGENIYLEGVEDLESLIAQATTA